MREFDLLPRVFAANAGLGKTVEIPPGDDMGMIRLSDRSLLAAVDQVVDGVHFRLTSTSIELVGRKAVTRSLSDVAAMAATPVASLAAVTIPVGFTSELAADLFEALRATAERYKCPLIGGDTAFHREPTAPLVCSVTVLAEPAFGPPIRRSGAQPGDALYVTGALGGSLERDGSGRHLTFEPRIEQAKALARALGDRLHAMIDISDGLGRDARHIAEQSGVRIAIDADRVPCNQGVTWKAALSDGEDYELCFAASGDVPASLPGGVAVTAVGQVLPPEPDRAAEPLVLVQRGGAILRGDEFGWQHQS